VPAQAGTDGSTGGVAVAVGPAVEIVGDATLPPLPAAVEVAAYRIVTESVANAVRHGAPNRCVVSIEATNGDLVLTIADDGRGIGPDAVPGVGLASMRERAAEVGGALDVSSDTGGTTVTARLPLELS
jgi:signal transduction histidine kinase